MQQYKAPQNVLIEQKNARRAEKRRGEIPFAIEGNTSGKIVNKYPKEYTHIPYVLTNTIVTSGSEFDVKTILTESTPAEFTVNILNTSEEPVKGTIQWIIM